MAIKIKFNNNKYYLEGKNNGLFLELDCSERISKYNLLTHNHCLYPNVEGQLYNNFSRSIHNNVRGDLQRSIDDLMKIYRLQRNAPFHGNRLAPIILGKRGIINGTPIFNLHNIDEIVRSFNELNRIISLELDRKLLPETSLSKILHFCKPNSFWIFDSNIGDLSKVFGYSGTFKGYVDLLKKLSSDTRFESFKNYILEVDHNMPGRNFLKIIDKILWLR